MRSTPTRAAGAAAVAALLAVCTVALAVSGGDPEQPTHSRSALLTIGQPIAPYRAGNPPGWIEMRIADPGGGRRRAALSYRTHELRRGHVVQLLCSRIGPERLLRRVRLTNAGDCMPVHGQSTRYPLQWSIGTGTREPVTINGQATPAVRRVVLSGPGGTYDVPLSRHGVFLLVYSAHARGSATLTAHLRDGSTRFQQFDLPPSFAQRGTTSVADPGGRAAWHVAAEARSSGPRKGQTCAQFTLGRFIRDFGAPLCGDLSHHAVFADTQRYGPRKGPHTYGPHDRSPRRVVVWGAVAPGVRGVRITQGGHSRSLSLSAVGRAFIAVYPAGVDPQAIALEVTLAGGTIERHRAPRRLNAVRLAEQPLLVTRRIGLRHDRADATRLVLSATLNLPAKRFDVKLAGREVHMHRAGGPDGRPRYAGIYDRSRGRPRTFVTGHVYLTSFVLCGGEGCSATTMRSRLR
ncbi:MAG: hypothetical protein QOJ35_1836 [Solirubrobacteraceae bacterium]|nr:hypothetical protein [Solirubrobacteraceae bacterium]